jgi:eukaryotic-like serine/threonine-protein kinase
MAMHPSVPEVRVVDRYAICQPIGRGGMGVVHLGRRLGAMGFTRAVAIKQLHPRFARDPRFTSMLMDEARMAARIHHPNVAGTIDVLSDAGELYLVMEYIAGRSLAELLAASLGANVPVPLPVAVALLVGVLHGLDAAHDVLDDSGEPLGLVHRDVSPQNVLVGVDGIARVIDFGIAKAAGLDHGTQPGERKGKVPYMPPEVLRGEPVTRRSDLYSAGIVLWETVTGRRLFPVDFATAYGQILAGVRQPPSSRRIPIGGRTLTTSEMRQIERIDGIVMRAVHPDPGRRYATAREMAHALETSLPLAGQSVVGRWVQQSARDALAERAAWIRAIELPQVVERRSAPTLRWQP